MASGDHLVVAAIDVGTTFSGYAFSFLHEYKKDPTSCSTFTWSSGVGGFQSLKTSTCVLFNSHGKFDSFGFMAEENYSNLALEKKHNGWLYFRRFKMKLYEQGLRKNFALEADNGKTMDAMSVFSAAINYLRAHLLQKCKDQRSGIEQKDILFVLTVPAIWTDPAKQFMREAAENGGIKREQLVLALEPEAASLFCKHLPVERNTKGTTAGCDYFRKGSKYIILDAGGGTIDITVHEIEENRYIREIHKANGGDWGGTKVDQAFYKLLSNIVGNDVMRTFSKEQKYDMLGLFTDFEVKKRTITPDLTEQITFKVPISLSQIYERLNKREIKNTLETNSSYAGKISWIGDKLRINADTVKCLYEESTYKITRHLSELFRKPAVADAKYIFMVGGFSESPMLQHAVKGAFPSKMIVIPKEAGLSVLIGATIFGREPWIFKYRVSKFTYGIRTSDAFVEQIHNASKKFTTSTGQIKCDELFSKHVEIGETIEVGQAQQKQYYTVLEHNQSAMSYCVYTSEETNPMYVTDKGCTYIGKLTVPIAGEGLDRGCDVSMTFSGTELKLEATEKGTGEKTTVFLRCD